MLPLCGVSWLRLSLLFLFLRRGVDVFSLVMYTVNERRTFAAQVMLCMEMVCNVHCVPAKGSACHPHAWSLLCVFRGLSAVGDEGHERATSLGTGCPETVPLPRCGRLNVCRILHATPWKQKNGTTVAKKRGHFLITTLVCRAQAGLFLGLFSGPLFSAGVPKGSANAARRVSSGRRSPALKKPRRTFQRRDQRAIH